MIFTVGELAAVAALAIPLLSFAGAWAAVRIHLHYLRVAVEQAQKSVRAAHWRLDEIGAPAAPFDHVR